MAFEAGHWERCLRPEEELGLGAGWFRGRLQDHKNHYGEGPDIGACWLHRVHLACDGAGRRGPSDCPLPRLVCSLPWQESGTGCIPAHEAYCKPYLGYLSLLPAILQLSNVKESVVRAAGGGGGAEFGRGPSSITTQLPSIQQFEVPPL